MDSVWPSAANVKPLINNQLQSYSKYVTKKVNNEKDLLYFKTKSPAFRHILAFVESLSDKIKGTSNKTLNKNYQIESDLFKKCSKLLDDLTCLCDETDLSQVKGSAPLRFGHIAFRDWYDGMLIKCRQFTHGKSLPESSADEPLSEELLCYLTESFGNRMRIDYGTGHELNFILFIMGLSCLAHETSESGGDNLNTIMGHHEPVTLKRLEAFVEQFGWDILALFAHKYLRLCRRVQTKFRLEPAGSRGVYNMDDFQFLPFLFGAAQMNGVKYIATKDFHNPDNVDMFKKDFIFFEAVDFILNNKRGPFHEHSYTLWCFTDLGSWDNIYRRIKAKFIDDVLGPFPIVQHILFGNYILKWEQEGENDDQV